MITLARKPLKSLMASALPLLVALLFISHPNTTLACDTCDTQEKTNMDTTMETAQDEAVKNDEKDYAEQYPREQACADGGANPNIDGVSQGCTSGNYASIDYENKVVEYYRYQVPSFKTSDAIKPAFHIAQNDRSCQILSQPAAKQSPTFANNNTAYPTSNYYQPVAFMGNTPRPSSLYSDLTHVALDMSSVIGPIGQNFTNILSSGGMGDLIKNFCQANPGGASICQGMKGSQETGSQGLQNMAKASKRPLDGQGSVGKPEKSQKTNQRRIAQNREPQERKDCQRRGSDGFGCTGQ